MNPQKHERAQFGNTGLIIKVLCWPSDLFKHNGQREST